jgi:hypothetical protein
VYGSSAELAKRFFYRNERETPRVGGVSRRSSVR